MAKKLTSFKDVAAAYASESPAEFFSTGLPFLDDLWGGGISPGSMYSLWAEPGCGKSTLCFQIAKGLAKLNKKTLFIDVEKALNSNQKKAFGLDKIEEAGLFQHLVVDTYADLENIVDAIEEENFSLVVIDSESALRPALPQDMHVTDVRPGLKAQQSSFILNKIKNMFYHLNIASIVIFQARANIQISGYGNGPALKQSGGFSALHIPDVITKISSHGKVKEGDIAIGVIDDFMCDKNKFTAPFVVVQKKLIYGHGISKRIDIIDSAIAAGLITMAGAGFYTLPNGEKVRGTKALYQVDKSILKELQEQLK